MNVSAKCLLHVASALALAFSSLPLGVGTSRALDLPEFRVPELHSLDLNSEELKGVQGVGRTAPPPDIITNTDRLNVHEGTPPPSNKMGKLPSEGAPPRSGGSPPREAGSNTGPKEAPNQGPKDTISNNGPKEAPKQAPTEAPKEPPKQTVLKEEPKSTPEKEQPKGEAGKDDPKKDPENKPSWFAQNKGHIAIMGVMITVGVVLPVSVQAIDGSIANQSSQNSNQ